MDVPAGWYPDPASPASARWWDGTGWTEHTTPLQRQPAAPQPAFAAPDAAATPAVADPPAAAAVAAVVVPPPAGDFVPPLVPASAPPAATADTAAYPSYGSATHDTAVYDTSTYDTAAYDASVFGGAASYPGAPAERRGAPWGVVALIGVLVLVLVAAVALVVRSVTSGSGGSTAASSTPTSAPGASSPAPTTSSPTPTSTTPTAGPGGTTPATAAQAAVVLGTFEPTTADLPAGIDATLIPQGDLVKGQRTLDGWCSTSYASEKNRIARRQWALTRAGQSIGLSIEAVAYGTPAQAAAALAEFTARTKACAKVTIVDSGTTLVQRLVSSAPLIDLPDGISGYRGVATFTGASTAGTTISVNSTSTVQRKGQYLTIVWTNQSTPITAADQQVIDRFVTQQTAALDVTTS